MFKFFLVVHSLIAAALVGVILMQRSEGGGFAGGGSPTGLLSARGAGDFLTRTTAILATLFITLSIGLAALATVNRAPTKLDDSLKTTPAAPSSALPTLPTIPAAGNQALQGGAAGQAQAPVAEPSREPSSAPKTEQSAQPVQQHARQPAENSSRGQTLPRHETRTQANDNVPSDSRTHIPPVRIPSVVDTPKAEPSIPSIPAAPPVTAPKVGPVEPTNTPTP